METQCVIAPSPISDWCEVDTVAVALARKVQGRVYRKHILNEGPLYHPVTGTTINIDKDFISSLKRNFDNNVCDIVQVPLANDKNEHVESPAANLGEVVGIEHDPRSRKVFALVDARKHSDDFGKTLLGASAFLHLNYKDSKTNKRVGPTLLHVAVTNRPYVTGLDPYEAVVAASSEDLGEPVLMKMSGDRLEDRVPRTLEEVLAELRDDHKVDVNDLKAQLSAAQDETEKVKNEAVTLTQRATDAEMKLSAVDSTLAERIAAALAGSEEGAKLSKAEGVSGEDVVNAVAELAAKNEKLAGEQTAALSRIEALEKKGAETRIDGLVRDGYILPAKRDVYLTMLLTQPDMFDQVLPEEPIVKMSVEKGVAPQGEEHAKRELNIDEEIARLTSGEHPAARYFSRS